MAVSTTVAVLRATAAVIAASSIAGAAARRILHARAEIVAHASLHLLLRLRRGAWTWKRHAIFRRALGMLIGSGGMFGAGFFIGMRDHAFFFGRGFLLFEFGVFGIFCKAFRVVLLRFVLFFSGFQGACFGFRVSLCIASFALSARCEIVLGFGDVLGNGFSFLVG